MALEKELAYFEAQKDELLEHYEDRFVVIKGEQLIGPFADEKEAYRAGLQEFGNTPFLIRRVTKEEQVAYFPALTLGLINADS